MKELPLTSLFLSRLYQRAWRLARPILSRNKRLRDGWSERLVPVDWVQPFDGATIWIQAASGGEAYLLVSLARLLLQKWNDTAPTGKLRILASTCTRQGMDVLERFQTQGSWSRGEFTPQFFPLDEPDLMSRAIALAKPCRIVLLETELWPGLLGAAKQAGVPVLLVNGRITPKSLSGYLKLPAPFRSLLAPDKILAVSQSDAERFARLFTEECVGLMPNIKFDLIDTEKDSPPGKQAETPGYKRAQLPIALFASVRRQEARQVAKAIKLFKASCPTSLAVLAPRHLHHADIWQREVRRIGLSCILRSQLQSNCNASPREVLNSFSKTDAVLVWDKFGELKQLYAEASTAYVGGSLVDLGGQNFLEALGAGVQPCVGPYISNFTWVGGPILDMLKHVKNADELAVALATELTNPKPKHLLKEEFFQLVKARQGGTRQAAEMVFTFPAAGDRL